MANEEKEMIGKFTEMVQTFQTRSNDMMNATLAGFSTNLSSAISNYLDGQKTYVAGYRTVASGARHAIKELNDTMDKHYSILKAQLATLLSETASKSTEALNSGEKTFVEQCEEIHSRFPMIPDYIYKEVLKAVGQNKEKLGADLKKLYDDVIKKIEENYVGFKETMTVPVFSTPTVMPLTLSPSIMNAAQNVVASVAQNAPGVLKHIPKLPGSSKK